ncbi:hypothetical protein DMA11_09315 [Marinilabiliaceae bacterium JC017]|nr:hypothetical protein DMA11_09315 [Marinilabiliaceae bacterium JC017]
MPSLILSYCDANEISSISANTLFELQKKEWTADVLIPGIINILVKENAALSNAIGDIRSNKYTAQLMELDNQFNKSFICLKHFVSANTWVPDEGIVQSAEHVWKIIEAHGVNLHRLGYEKQIVLADSLLRDFEKEEIKSLLNPLVGVPACVTQLKVSVNELRNLYREAKENEASKEERIAPSTQKNVVKEIINNDLLPYLEVMSKVNPEEYRETTLVIKEYIDSINTKARMRKSRTNNHAPVADDAEQESNQE